MKALAQGHMAGRSLAPGPVLPPLHPVAPTLGKPELYKGRNGVIFLSPCHPKAKTRLLPWESPVGWPGGPTGVTTQQTRLVLQG